jgi:predicted nucleotidyltransferase
MNLQRPFRTVTPTLEGDVLTVLARADTAFTGREVHRRIGTASHRGVQVALGRLITQGIVTRERAGRSNLYRLNRNHLAAPFIEGIASLRLQLIHEMREAIAAWELQPVVAALFGSVARGEADEDSDIDILLIRPAEADAEDDLWREQVRTLEDSTAAWSGNDARTLEYAEDELPELRTAEPVVREIVEEGIALAGSLAVLRTQARRQHQ